jgi:hypothetical protein
MNNDIKNSGVNDSDIAFALNNLSGMCSVPFWEILYCTCESLLAIENTEIVLLFLYDEGHYEEALKLIRAYYEVLGIEWPDELAFVERIDELKEPFIKEFLLDAEDILLDYRYEREMTALS